MSFCNQCGAELPDGARFCGSCGAPVAGAASAPPPPASPPVPPYAAGERPTSFSQPVPPGPVGRASGGLGWILPALVIAALAAIAYLLLTPRNDAPAAEAAQDGAASGAAAGQAPAEVASGPPAAATSVPAAVLDSTFHSDPGGSALRYSGPIRVSGTIASMVQPGSTPSLSMEGRTRFNFMVVNFPAGYRERLAPLSKGQFVTVSCDGVRGFAGTTILSGCLLG